MARVAGYHSTAGFGFSRPHPDALQPRGVLPTPPAALDRQRSRSPRLSAQSRLWHDHALALSSREPKHRICRDIGRESTPAAATSLDMSAGQINKLNKPECDLKVPDPEVREANSRAAHVGGTTSGFLLRPKSKPGKPEKGCTRVPPHAEKAYETKIQDDKVANDPDSA